jgi:hypothetical protein
MTSSSLGSLLWLLSALFAARVLGQAFQLWAPQPFLPPFAAFQGSSLPYQALLPAQLAVLGAMFTAAWRAQRGVLRGGARTGRRLGMFGKAYLAGALARIAIGLAVPAAPRWFSSWIPGAFHVVLAAFVLTLATACRPEAGRPAESAQ